LVSTDPETKKEAKVALKEARERDVTNNVNEFVKSFKSAFKMNVRHDDFVKAVSLGSEGRIDEGGNVREGLKYPLDNVFVFAQTTKITKKNQVQQVWVNFIPGYENKTVFGFNPKGYFQFRQKGRRGESNNNGKDDKRRPPDQNGLSLIGTFIPPDGSFDDPTAYHDSLVSVLTSNVFHTRYNAVNLDYDFFSWCMNSMGSWTVPTDGFYLRMTDMLIGKNLDSSLAPGTSSSQGFLTPGQVVKVDSNLVYSDLVATQKSQRIEAVVTNLLTLKLRLIPRSCPSKQTNSSGCPYVRVRAEIDITLMPFL